MKKLTFCSIILITFTLSLTILMLNLISLNANSTIIKREGVNKLQKNYNPINNNEKLVYNIAFIYKDAELNENIDSTKQKQVNEIRNQVAQEIIKEKLNFNFVDSPKEFPDVIFILTDDNSICYSKNHDNDYHYEYRYNRKNRDCRAYKHNRGYRHHRKDKHPNERHYNERHYEERHYNNHSNIDCNHHNYYDNRLHCRWSDCTNSLRPHVKIGNNAALECVNYLKKTFYSGNVPEYSTVFTPGEHGYIGFRIPSVVTLSSGRILAIIEARGEGRTDCAENDIVLKYSDDEGKTWSDIIQMAESGKASLNNPTSVYIKEKNRVLVMFQEYPPKLNEGSADSGFNGNITRTYTIFSDDEGLTWSKKKDITKQIKQINATGYASGPGAMIRVTAGPDKGSIIAPLNVSGGKNGWYNYLAISNDFGENWNILEGKSSYGTNESQIVQLTDTEFLINARCHKFTDEKERVPEGWSPWNFGRVTRCRAYIPVTIQNGKAIWHKTRLRYDLPDPLCQGGIFRYSGLENGTISRLIFVNAANDISVPDKRGFQRTPVARVNGTVRISYNNGRTWKYSKRFYGNRFTEFMYSVPTKLKSGKIGCLFEAGDVIKFASFGLDWLTCGEDKCE